MTIKYSHNIHCSRTIKNTNKLLYNNQHQYPDTKVL